MGSLGTAQAAQQQHLSTTGQNAGDVNALLQSPLNTKASIAVPALGTADLLYSRASEHPGLRDTGGIGSPRLSARLSKRDSSKRNPGEQPRITEYMALRQKRAKIDTEASIQGYNKNERSKPMLISIESVKGLSLEDTVFKNDLGVAGITYEVEYHCTLFSAQQSPGYTGFYGRTYISRPKPLESTDVTKEDFIFLHSPFVQPSSRLIVEVVVTQTRQGKKQARKASGGFAELQIFDTKMLGKSQDCLVTAGSPRMLGAHHLDISQGKRSKTLLRYSCREHQPFKVLVTLTPHNCLVGQDEKIPGLQGGLFMLPRENPQMQLSQTPLHRLSKTVAYLHNLKLVVTPAFETTFERFLRNVSEAVRGEPLNSTGVNVNIHSRQLQVQINNSWMDLDDAENTVNLAPPDESSICRSTNSITLKQYIPHPLVALCFKVIYTAKIPTKKNSNRQEFIVGWEVSMPTLISGSELPPLQKIDFFCKQGPGVSVMKDLLWSAPDNMQEEFNLRIAGQLSLE